MGRSMAVYSPIKLKCCCMVLIVNAKDSAMRTLMAPISASSDNIVGEKMDDCR